MLEVLGFLKIALPIFMEIYGDIKNFITINSRKKNLDKQKEFEKQVTFAVETGDVASLNKMLGFDK